MKRAIPLLLALVFVLAFVGVVVGYRVAPRVIVGLWIGSALFAIFAATWGGPRHYR